MPTDPLEVEIVNARVQISIGIETLAKAINQAGPLAEQGAIVYDAAVFAEEIIRELKREEEDGTTVVHRLFDGAAWSVWENGGEGIFTEDDLDDESDDDEEGEDA